MTHPKKDNQAERAAWERWAEHQARVAYRDEQHGLVFYDAGTKIASWVAWQASAACRTAHALDAEGLPALKPVAVVASEYVGCGIRCAVASWKMPGPPDGTELYTAEQVRQAQRDAIAASESAAWLTLAHIICADAEIEPGHIADRLGKLRTMLEEQRARQDQQPARASVDSPDFCDLVARWAGAAHSCDKYTRTEGARDTWRALIAHINAWGGVTEDHTKQEK